MTYTNSPLFKRRAVGFFSLLLFVPQTWGSAFGAGFAYTARQRNINRPFLRGGGGKTKNGAGRLRFFIRIRVVLVLGWRRRL